MWEFQLEYMKRFNEHTQKQLESKHMPVLKEGIDVEERRKNGPPLGPDDYEVPQTIYMTRPGAHGAVWRNHKELYALAQELNSGRL